MNISMLLDMAAESGPDRVAVGSGRDALTYGELRDAAGRIGRRLRDAEVEHVALLDLNSPVVPVLLFAAASAGIPFAPLNYRWTDEQLSEAAGRLGRTVIVAGPEQSGRIALGEGAREVPTATVIGEWASAPVDEPCDGYDVDPEDVAVVLFTSGTTGSPKAALLRHRHLVSYIVSTVEFFGCDDDEAILVSVPNYHVAGLASVLSSTYSGRRMVQLPGFAPDVWARTAADEAITHAMVVPTMLGRVLDELDAKGEKLGSLRSLSYGGGRMPVPVLQRALDQLPHVDFVNAYGLTETSSTIAVLGPEDHRVALSSEDPAVRARLGSVGRIIETLELEVRDDEGVVQPAGSPGEIFVRGEQIAGEYATHSALVEGGWYPTNDRGYVDDGGYLFLDGRADDVIVRGGENISPGEIEDALTDHPSVRDAAVVGVPHPEWGEAVVAVVVLADGAELDVPALKEGVRARLRSTRVPEQVHAWTELPYNETGKLLRRQIRADLETLADREDLS